MGAQAPSKYTPVFGPYIPNSGGFYCGRMNWQTVIEDFNTKIRKERRYLRSELGCKLLNCTWLVYFRLVETVESTKNAKSSLIALVCISVIERANSMFQPLSAPSPHARHATCTLMTTHTETADRRICRKTRTRTNRRVETRHVRQTSLRLSQNTVGVT